MRIALTGNIGSGKSTIARMFQDLGARVADADEVVKEYYKQGNRVYQEVATNFGVGILDANNNISRKKLADIVFSDGEKLAKLEGITHRALKSDLENWFDDDVCIVEASLIFEKNADKDYDKTVVVYAPYEVSRVRAIGRGMALEDFERRWQKQASPEDKVRKASYVIDNIGSLDEVKEKVEEVYNKLFLWNALSLAWKEEKLIGDFESIYQEVVEKYSGRGYHNLSHVVDMLKEVSRHLWLDVIGHDIVYEAKAGYNEERSVDWTYDIRVRFGTLPELAETKKRRILVTKHNAKTIPETRDEKLICDADLSIFAASEEKFDRYNVGIRKEYCRVKDEEYRLGRIKVLKYFLNKAETNSLYYLTEFQTKYNEKAKINLKRAIEELNAPDRI